MNHKNRGYKRDYGVKLRDYRLFAIACEGGKREPQYFKLFEHLSNRIKVDVIENKILDEELFHKYETKSAPKWVLDRAITYIEQEGLIDEDELWFVMDVDRWEKEQLWEIIYHCEQNTNWNIVLSNPCFEVWLYLHNKSDIQSSKSVSCNDFKNEIAGFDTGGYNVLNYISKIYLACENAKSNDSDSKNDFPNQNETKVYKLVESILDFVSIAQFEVFLNQKLPLLIEQQKIGLKKTKIRVNIKR